MIPEALKDSYVLFDETYEHLSPLHGALSWESGIVKNYYEAASHAPHSRDMWLAQTDGPSRLAEALFTNTLGNFDVSTHPNYPARHLGISTIANLIAILEQTHEPLDPLKLEDFILRDVEFNGSVQAINREREDLKQQYDRLIKQAQKQHQTDTVATLKNSKILALNKLSTHRLCQDWARIQSITQLKARLTQIDQLTGPEKARAQKERSQAERSLGSLESAQGNKDYNRVRELAYALADSHTPSLCHPPHIAQWLLLSCLYRKAHTKKDFMHYMTLLAEKIPHVLCKQPDESYIQSSFAHDETQYLSDIHTFLQQAPLHTIQPHLYEKLVYTQIIQRFYKGFLPKITEYANISYHGVSFPDCVEATLLNFCNMIIYDRASGTFNIEKLPLDKHPEILASFYADPVNQQATNNHLTKVHQDWGQLLQNLPFITYRQLIHITEDGSILTLTAPKDTNGFIRGIPDSTISTLEHNGNRVKIADRWYICVNNPHDILCEMHPTLRNIIITLDTLFKLNLFASCPLEQAFLSAHFNAQYMPLLCSNFTLFQNKQFTPEELESIDKDEYTEKGFRLKFNLFDLILTDEHAEIITHIKRDSIADLGPTIVSTLAQLSRGTTQSILAQLLSIFPIEQDTIPAEYPLTHILYLPLDHPKMLVNAALFCLQKTLDGTLPKQLRTYLLERALCFLRQLPERLDWHYHEEFLRRVDPRILKFDGIQQELARIKSVALKRLEGISAECEYVPVLYTALLQKQEDDDRVMTIVDNLIARTDSFDRNPLLILLIELVQQGKALKQTQQAVDICKDSPVESERTLAHKLLDLLRNI
jgi:hypothetical protein